MRHPHTFILTVLLVDRDPTGVRGRVRSLASERETTFTEVDELMTFVRTEAQRIEDVPPDRAGDGEHEEAEQ